MGTGVAVHLPINFDGLSEWKEKNRENYEKKMQQKPNNHLIIKVVAACRLVPWITKV